MQDGPETWRGPDRVQQRVDLDFHQPGVAQAIRGLQRGDGVIGPAPLGVDIGVLVGGVVAHFAAHGGKFRLGGGLLAQQVVGDGQAVVLFPVLAGGAGALGGGGVVAGQRDAAFEVGGQGFADAELFGVAEGVGRFARAGSLRPCR